MGNACAGCSGVDCLVPALKKKGLKESKNGYGEGYPCADFVKGQALASSQFGLQRPLPLKRNYERSFVVYGIIIIDVVKCGVIWLNPEVALSPQIKDWIGCIKPRSVEYGGKLT